MGDWTDSSLASFKDGCAPVVTVHWATSDGFMIHHLEDALTLRIYRGIASPAIGKSLVLTSTPSTILGLTITYSILL
jgi:hypothetical protein